MQLQDLSTAEDDKPEEEDVPKIRSLRWSVMKSKQVQLPDLSAAKDDQTAGDTKIKPEMEDMSKIKPQVEDVSDAKDAEGVTKPEVDLSVTKDAQEVAESREDLSDAKVAEEDVSATKDAEVTTSSSSCKCYTGRLQSPLSKYFECLGLAHCPARKDKIICDIEAAAAVQPEPVQLLDLSTTEEEETASNSKSAAQVFMEAKVEKIKARQKMGAKLALLKREVKLGQQLLRQTRTLLESKKALVKRKVRVTYNKCHKFWRGQVISAYKSDVNGQVDAAKARLGLRRLHNQFNISAMTSIIDKLAPEGCYNSAKPPLSSTSPSRPRVRTFAPRRPPPSPRRTRSLAIPAPPVLFSRLAKKSPAWYRGDKCIVSHGDSIAEDLCIDNLTQLEYCDDGHEDKVEDSFTCEDCASVDAKELEVECHDTKEHEVESNNAGVEDFSNAKELQSTAWYRGDPCIDSHGDAITEDLCYDKPTQLEHCDDEFLWDGTHDFTSHEEESEFDVDFICEGCGFDDAKELEEGFGSCDAEVETCIDAEEEIYCYDNEQDVNAEDFYHLCYDVGNY